MLQKLTNSQKKSISKYSRQLCDLRTLVTNFTNALHVDKDANIATLTVKTDILVECYANSSILLNQFSVVLKACPENELGEEPNFDSVLSYSPIVKCYKNSDEWKELYSKIKSIITIVNKQKITINKVLNCLPKQIGKSLDVPRVSQSHVDVTNEATSILNTIRNDIEDMLKEYQFKLKIVVDKDFIPRHPILKILENYSKYLKDVIDNLNELDAVRDASMEDDTDELTNQTEDLIATMLLVIQSIYKKHLPLDKSSDNNDVLNAIDEIIDEGKEKQESKEILEDKHLKKLLQENLSIDSKMLQLETLTDKLNVLLFTYVQHLATNKNIEVRNVVERVVPILEQTLLFVQYFVTQKVAVHRVSCKMLSVLLKIFGDLATKG